MPCNKEVMHPFLSATNRFEKLGRAAGRSRSCEEFWISAGRSMMHYSPYASEDQHWPQPKMTLSKWASFSVLCDTKHFRACQDYPLHFFGKSEWQRSSPMPRSHPQCSLGVAWRYISSQKNNSIISKKVTNTCMTWTEYTVSEMIKMTSNGASFVSNS